MLTHTQVDLVHNGILREAPHQEHIDHTSYNFNEQRRVRVLCSSEVSKHWTGHCILAQRYGNPTPKASLPPNGRYSRLRNRVSPGGAGRIRHISTPTLWLQCAVQEGKVRLSKCPGKTNPADLGTKHVERSIIDTTLKMMNFVHLTGQSALALRAAV